MGGCMYEADTVIIKQWGRESEDSDFFEFPAVAQSDESMGVLSEAC